MSDAHLRPDAGAREHEHIAGGKDAAITLVEYGDYECSYCGMAYPIVKSIQRQLGDRLRFVFRNFPLQESHPHAEHAAEAAEAVAASGDFWRMHDLLYEHQNALDDRSLVDYATTAGAEGADVARALDDGTYRKRVREDFRSGVRSGVNGTPAFFINGERFDGDWSDEAEFLRVLERFG